MALEFKRGDIVCHKSEDDPLRTDWAIFKIHSIYEDRVNLSVYKYGLVATLGDKTKFPIGRIFLNQSSRIFKLYSRPETTRYPEWL